MFTKNRIKLLSALAIILIVGLFLVINNLRPVSERKKSGREKLNVKKEVQKISRRISLLSDSIKEFSDKSLLFYQRAKLYKSINKYNEALEDYKIFIEKTNNSDLKEKAKKEIKSIEKVKEFLENQ